MDVRLAELVNVEVGLHSVGVDVQGLGEEVLPLLRVVPGLEGIVQYLGGPDAHAVGRIRHLVDLRVGEVYAPVLYPFRGTAHENEVLLVLDGAVQNLAAVFQPLPQKQLLVVSGGGNADQQFVGVGFHGLFE